MKSLFAEMTSHYLLARPLFRIAALRHETLQVMYVPYLVNRALDIFRACNLESPRPSAFLDSTACSDFWLVQGVSNYFYSGAHEIIPK